MTPRRPRRFSPRRTAAATLRAATLLVLGALVAGPETTLVWSFRQPEWMMQPRPDHGLPIPAGERVVVVPSFVFPTDVGSTGRLDAGIQSRHAVQRTTDLDPGMLERAWQRFRENPVLLPSLTVRDAGAAHDDR